MTTQLSSPFEGMSQTCIAYISELQKKITATIESYESSVRFSTDSWQRDGGGGGITMLLEKGDVFEKAGVNISAIQGQLNTQKEKEMFSVLLSQQKKQSFDLNDAIFFATGISLVIHPVNPFCPAVHMNVRYFEMRNQKETIWWFGGGADLTPAIEFEEDNKHFHQTLKSACDTLDASYYPIFKQKCDEYFYLPHRNEARGIGGVFYDYLNVKEPDHYMRLTKAIGDSFNQSYFPIIDRRFQQAYSRKEKQKQWIKRGRYVEFNLLYDRGTLFGLKTGGRVESILMSLPPIASW